MIDMTIKEFRIAQGLSQGELAQALEISISTERSYEYGVRQPSEKALAKLKEVYGVDLETAEAPKKPGRKKKAEAIVEAVVETAVEKVESLKKPGRKKKAAPAKEAPAPVEEAPAPVEEAPAPVEEKPEAPKKAPALVIQSPMGGSITPEEILARVGEADAVYVRVDQNKAYWVRGEESGSIDLW